VAGVPVTASVAISETLSTCRKNDGFGRLDIICLPSRIGHIFGDFLSIKSTYDARQGLRVILQRLEEAVDVAQDAEATAELKRIVLHRIAELDAAETVEGNGTENPGTP
jgi:hypothetical protein